ncbi:HSP90 family protein [Geosporobacter ferrireducens]|uniref:HSP90 family protein n=1 Tax=Geosporobacter ferrireducens TaxID=1424294 RepID=A0A1D8GIA2_9FIRM|nr:HSP90 family protein [Geosporobacter ferrireducens]AOT70629.1 HSP90 family protein [Geosporobacter ferrireducens]MTI57425.1 HSP90 family protein [Geosporobacter ferrireducens]
MEKDYRFKVNLGGMIDILSNHLYSSPDVFVRELLQNAVDAINARKKSENFWPDGKITISLIEDTIIFEDNGIGLTEEEIHKFVAIIGESSKKDLISGKIEDDYIGKFGIGLLSCFMISDEINLVTRSINEESGYHWTGKPDGTYSIKRIAGEIGYGTIIYLRGKKGSEVYYNDENLVQLIRYYGLALPIPIFFNKNGSERRINESTFIWDDRSLSKNDVLAMGKEIFNEEFIDYIPMESKSAQVKGIAYIVSRKVGIKAKNSHRIYLKSMLLTEKGDNLLPEWAFFVKCIINTNLLRPTASRETFYEDDLLDKTRDELGECIIHYLSNIAVTDTEKLSQIVSIHDLAIKSLAVENDNLHKVFFDYLLFQTSQGTKSGYELRTQYKILQYTNSVDKFKQISPIFTAQDKLLINGGYVYIAELIEMLGYLHEEVKVELVNTDDVVEIMEDLTYEEEEFSYGLLKIANIVLNKFNCQASIKHFKPKEMPTLYTMDTHAMFYRDLIENKEKSRSSFGDILDGFIDEYEGSSYSNLCFNFDNPLIQKLMTLTEEVALKNAVELLYVQSLLMGHFPLRYNEMRVLNNGIISLIEWGINK